VAASVAMMMNFIARRDLGLNQRTILRWAQLRDVLDDATQHGSDPLGWALAATEWSRRIGHPTTYRWVAYRSRSAALQAAAMALFKTKKPVGLLVWAGKHAIVMTGATMVDGRVTTIVTSDPYRSGPTVGRHRVWSATSFPLLRYRVEGALPEYPKEWYDKYVQLQWYEKYIVILPAQ
jgi:hypothetical protein